MIDCLIKYGAKLQDSDLLLAVEQYTNYVSIINFWDNNYEYRNMMLGVIINFLYKGLDVNFCQTLTTSSGEYYTQTPLKIARQSGDQTLIRLLLLNGANPD